MNKGNEKMKLSLSKSPRDCLDVQNTSVQTSVCELDIGENLSETLCPLSWFTCRHSPHQELNSTT